jgi:hypothetical protein
MLRAYRYKLEPNKKQRYAPAGRFNLMFLPCDPAGRLG